MIVYNYKVWCSEITAKRYFSLESVVCPKKGTIWCKKPAGRAIYLAFWDFLGRSTAWMLGRTPPWAMVTPERSLFNSSSLRMAS